MITKGPKVGRLFPLQFTIPAAMSLSCNSVGPRHEIWHKRLGHPNTLILSHLLKRDFLGNNVQYQFSNLNFDCDACKLGKSMILPFSTHGTRANKCFEIVHSDVWSITPITSHAQCKYFVMFIDDFDRYTWIYFLRSKMRSITLLRLLLLTLRDNSLLAFRF